ncbi:unnamed protein product [Adineta ricciae]|uniref:Uncharacterized protein n=1 Tax=Adineta ricciae TaxID=249248 RepID=A0A815L1Z4_ADIRI|nr:unnamed protein product [Adineta ricciae]
MSSQDENANIVSNEEKPIPSANQKRRVRFPSDESQLRMISIAPEPLANQPLLSLGVILQRYRGACQRLQIRPLNCLLEQLSNMDDGRKTFNDRLECLKVVNERLDLKHMDAIEEILSRCRFYVLDFDSSFSDDTTLVQFFDIIEYYDSCTHLNLSNNRSINFHGYQALTRYMRKTRVLERLDMNSIRFDDASMLGFGRSLRMSSTLYELHVESCQLNGKLLQKLIQNIRACPCLRELYLCDNRLQVQDSILINELIRSCGQFLHVLDLRSNSLQDNGMSHIASQLSQYDEHHTHQNTIYKISFQSNQLTYQGVAFLAKALLHNRTIRSLNLSYNQITNEGLYLLRDALLTNRTINELILRNCRLTDQAAIALAEFIAESSVIQYLDLRENNIQASGICGMAIAMKNNKSLLKVDFDSIDSSTNPSFNQSIDRTASSSNGLLSLSNLRRMTVGLGSFSTTNNSASSSNQAMNHNVKELNEQKAKWMNDIECICQRNLLLYEDQLRRQEEEQLMNNHEITDTNGIDHHEASITTPNGVISEEKDENKENSIDTNEHNSEETPITTDDNLQTNETSADANEQSEPTEDHPKSDNVTEQPTNEHNSNDACITTDTTNSLPNDDNHEIVQTTPTEPMLNNSQPLPDSPEDNLTDDEDDEKQQIRHSDSLYLLRKKTVHHADGSDTSDDESQLSTIIEPTQETVDGI